MDFIKLIYNGKDYVDDVSSGMNMSIISCFLTEDSRGRRLVAFKECALDDACRGACGDITALEKDSGNIILTDMYSEETIPTEVIMTVHQFVQLLDEWDEKVCKPRPREVTIIYENDQYRIETKA